MLIYQGCCQQKLMKLKWMKLKCNGGPNMLNNVGVKYIWALWC